MAALISFAGSWIPSFWGDEAASLMSAERPLPSLFRMLGHVDAVHGAYYLGLHAWIDAFGASPLATRLPSAVAVGVVAAGVYVLVRQLGTRRLAIAAAVVTAIVPRVTWFGLEARSYAFGAAIAVWLLVVLVRAVEARSGARRWWVLYAVVLACGIYTFLFFGLLVVVHAIVLFQARADRVTRRRWGMATGVGILLASPVIVFGLAQHGQVGYLAGRQSVTPTSLLVTTWFGSVPVAVVAWLAIALAAVFLVADVIRDRRITRPPGTQPISLTVLALAWLFVPLVILAASNFAVADFSPRYLSYSAPAAGILIATGIVRTAGLLAPSGRRRRGRSLVVVGIVVVAGLALPGYVAQRTPYAKNDTGWQSISQVVGAHAAPGDAVAFDESTRSWQRPRLALTTYPKGFAGLRDVTLETSFVDADWWSSSAFSIDDAIAKGRFDGVRRIWMVEYRSDDYGLAELRAHGFREIASYDAHGARVVGLAR